LLPQITGVARNLSWRGALFLGGTPDPLMAAVDLPSSVPGRKVNKFGTFLLKMYFWRLGGGYCPPLSLPGYTCASHMTN